MWKHKLQEALDKQIYSQQIFEKAKSKLDEAVTFYLGDIFNIQKICEPYKNTNTPLLCPSDLRLPYDTCLFIVDANIDGKMYRYMPFFFKKENSNNEFYAIPFILDGETAVLNDLYCIIGYDYKEILGFHCKTDEYEPDAKKYDSNLQTCLSCGHAGLMLLSCKNITTVTIPGKDKLNKKRIKKCKFPITEYKILKIKPTDNKNVYISEKENKGYQGLHRVHLCRGHFKEYTKENPLFGKYVGRFWWQPMVRGDKKRGILNKDYDVVI